MRKMTLDSDSTLRELQNGHADGQNRISDDGVTSFESQQHRLTRRVYNRRAASMLTRCVHDRRAASMLTRRVYDRRAASIGAERDRFGDWTCSAEVKGSRCDGAPLLQLGRRGRCIRS